MGLFLGGGHLYTIGGDIVEIFKNQKNNAEVSLAVLDDSRWAGLSFQGTASVSLH